MFFEYTMIGLYLVGILFSTLGMVYYTKLEHEGFKFWFLIYIFLYPVFIFGMLVMFPPFFAYLKKLEESRNE